MVEKLTSVSDAVSSIPAGSSLSFGGFGHYGHPLALVREIIRQRIANLTLYAIAECWPAELLTAAGLVRHIDMSNLMFEGLGRVRAICRAVENGEITTDDHSHLGLSLRLLAAGWGVPFLPIHTMAGSDLEHIQSGDKPKFARIPSPFGDEWTGVVSALQPDVAIIHVHQADTQGNGIIHGQISVVDAQVRAARRVILSTEELVDGADVVAHNQLTVIPGFLVDTVVHTPYGSHPGGVYGRYDEDQELLEEYYQASRSPDTLADWLTAWVYDLGDHIDYLDQVGSQRLARVVVDPELKLSRGRGEY
ncbi:MAG: CoA transferase subunit A [Beutenbergiaceae bacterium]